MAIKIELSMIPALAQVAAGDRALVVHGSSGRLAPVEVLGSSAAIQLAGEDGNFYTPSVVIDDGIASIKLTIV
jgi:hypothetical protein